MHKSWTRKGKLMVEASTMGVAAKVLGVVEELAKHRLMLVSQSHRDMMTVGSVVHWKPWVKVVCMRVTYPHGPQGVPSSFR